MNDAQLDLRWCRYCGIHHHNVETCWEQRRPFLNGGESICPKHKASERLRALARAACGTGRPAISSPDMRISASWEQLELVATELEKMGL